MIKRDCFVSNSSSSSFVVIQNNTHNTYYYPKPYEKERENYVIGKKGQRTFECGKDEYNDIHSKINWAYIQAYTLSCNYNYPKNNIFYDFIVPNKNYITEMLFPVIKFGLNVKNITVMKSFYYQPNDLNPSEEDDHYFDFKGHIDHQSVGYENFLIFSSNLVLYNFIFNDCSKIYTDSDGNIYLDSDPIFHEQKY